MNVLRINEKVHATDTKQDGQKCRSAAHNNIFTLVMCTEFWNIKTDSVLQ